MAEKMSPSKTDLPEVVPEEDQDVEKRPRTCITWKRAAPMPARMLQPQVVATQDLVYAGGGASMYKEQFHGIYAYHIATDTWITLPQARVILGGLCHFQGALLTIGGGDVDGITGQVYKLHESRGEWCEDLAPMPTARFSLSIFSNDTVIVACGGGMWTIGNENPYPCDTVEVYDSSTRAWSVARHLPRLCAAMSNSMVGNLCYMLGDVESDMRTGPLYADLRNILKPASEVVEAAEDTPTTDWEESLVPPIDNAGIVATPSYILAIGGNLYNRTRNWVHIYISGKWWKCTGADLPHALESPGMAILPSGELMVVGGESLPGIYVDSVFIGNMP